jgi:hypothetical protein
MARLCAWKHGRRCAGSCVGDKREARVGEVWGVRAAALWVGDGAGLLSATPLLGEVGVKGAPRFAGVTGVGSCSDSVDG